MVNWGVARQHNCGSKVRCADNGHRYLALRYAELMPIIHHFHDCTALLVWRFVVVKWHYIKYKALPFFTFLQNSSIRVVVCATHKNRFLRLSLLPSFFALAQNKLHFSKSVNFSTNMRREFNIFYCYLC